MEQSSFVNTLPYISNPIEEFGNFSDDGDLPVEENHRKKARTHCCECTGGDNDACCKITKEGERYVKVCVKESYAQRRYEVASILRQPDAS